jgi:hypothetical protein
MHYFLLTDYLPDRSDTLLDVADKWFNFLMNVQAILTDVADQRITWLISAHRLI